jgi:ubiquinone biosynthesis protein
MEVQPQLVLLQKTLLYIEGLGRQLYPQLDLWKTAKPFLEDWVKEQMGPMSVLKQIKTNFPFWAEKLPELPDLIYLSLKQQNKQQIKEKKAPDQKPTLLAMVSCTGFIITTLLFISNKEIEAITIGTIACFSFIAAWRKL